MSETNNSSSKKGVAEAIMICLDTSIWMENTKSPMFEEQAEAIRLYCTKKFESHSSTVVGLCGMADYNIYYLIFPTRNLEDIIGAIYGSRIGGYLRLSEAASYAYSFWFGNKKTDMQKRIVFFAGGPLYCPLDEAADLGRAFKNRNAACDAISFGDPHLNKRELFNTVINLTDNRHVNCNVCHVPPESSVPEALSRSEIIIPRVGGGTSSSLPPSMDKEEMAIQICVKAPPTADANTDCPFCQWVLLTLEEKNVLYHTEFIDLGNKPDWFVDVNPDGLLPLISFGDGKWVSNSHVIVKMIETKCPRTPFATPPYHTYLGLKILPKLLAFLKNKNDGTEQALLFELMELEEQLSEHGGPYVNGDNITAIDLSLAPKLYHLVEACKHFNTWTIPKRFAEVLNYNKLLFSRRSFKISKPLLGDVIAGWAKKLEVNA